MTMSKYTSVSPKLAQVELSYDLVEKKSTLATETVDFLTNDEGEMLSYQGTKVVMRNHHTQVFGSGFNLSQ